MRFLLPVVFILAAEGLSQIPPEKDSLPDLKVGERIEVVLWTRFAFRGTLIPTREFRGGILQDVNPVQAKMITLDVTHEFADLAEGTISFDKRDIKLIRRVRVLDDAAIRIMLDAKQEKSAERLRADAERKISLEKEAQEPATLETPRKEGDVPKNPPDAGTEANPFQRGMDLLKKFPPEDGWGDDKYAALQAKKLKVAVNKMPLTAHEREFMENIDLWRKAKADVDKLKEETPK